MRRVIDSGCYVLGPELRRFEDAFAQFCGGGHVVGVGNGTDAITLALMALGVGEGDAVITVSHTARASAVGISRAGATPVFVDIDPRHYTMSPAALEDLLGRWGRNPQTSALRPKVVMPVHLYGQPADMVAIAALAGNHDLFVLADCAQAHGAALNGQPVAAWSAAATFSFYPTKNLGACGDGGAVLVRDPATADAIRTLRQYGAVRNGRDLVGMNSRLDEFQAALLSVRLRGLDADNARRREIAATYHRVLGQGASAGLRLPSVAPGVRHAWHQYVVAHRARDRLAAHLAAEGIETLVHYPVPIHRQPAYGANSACQSTRLAETERAAREVLSLPVHPRLSDDEVARVAAGVLGFVG